MVEGVAVNGDIGGQGLGLVGRGWGRGNPKVA